MPLFKFLGNFLKKIGEFFSSLTKGAEKVWDNLEEDIQLAIKKASGIVAIINENIQDPPEIILALIKAKYPDLPVEKIQEISNEVAKDLNIAGTVIQPDILVTIANIQTVLGTLEGSRWAKKSEDIAGLIAIVLAPDKTPWNKIGTIMWWVYQTFIKKD